jgi:hypothetical protein
VHRTSLDVKGALEVWFAGWPRQDWKTWRRRGRTMEFAASRAVSRN